MIIAVILTCQQVQADIARFDVSPSGFDQRDVLDVVYEVLLPDAAYYQHREVPMVTMIKEQKTRFVKLASACLHPCEARNQLFLVAGICRNDYDVASSIWYDALTNIVNGQKVTEPDNLF